MGRRGGLSKGRPPVDRSPQEKKALSLEKDRRNNYAANAKASRKLIPLRKAKAARQARHAADQALAVAVGLDAGAVDIAESSVRQDIHRVGGWTKSPDGTLADHLERQDARAERRTGRKARNRAQSGQAD